MSMEWKTTIEDLIIVLDKHGVLYTDDSLVEIDGRLDMELIEAAALEGLDIDTQTRYAHEEIEKQLKEDRII